MREAAGSRIMSILHWLGKSVLCSRAVSVDQLGDNGDK